MIYIKKTDPIENLSILAEEAKYDDIKKAFNLDPVFDDLMDPIHRERLLKIDKSVDKQFCADLAASIFKNIYQKDIKVSARNYHAHMLYHGHLTGILDINKTKGHLEFLGLLLRDEEYTQRDVDRNQYYKKVKIDNSLVLKRGDQYSDGVTINDQGKVVPCDYSKKIKDKEEDQKTLLLSHPVRHVFEGKIKADTPKNVFILVGSQTLGMLYSRIRKSALIISDLLTSELIKPESLFVVFSGLNNAQHSEMKVNYSNESQVMRAKFILRLKKYLGRKTDVLKKIILEERLILETGSKNTKENIEESLKKILMSETDSYNLYVISNTFHLPQIYKEISTAFEKFDKANLGHLESLFFIGCENPRDTFKLSDAELMKFVYKDAFRIASSKIS